MTEYNYTIDILRFFAASIVVLFHFNESFSDIQTFYTQISKYGSIGVPIFFVISGYCIFLSAKHSKSSLDFMVRRLFRIFPAFWFSVVIVVLVVLLQIIFRGQNSVTVLPKTTIDILKTFTLLTEPFGNTPTINWVYWSLTVELFFYIIVFIGLIFTRKLLIVALSATAFALLISPSVSPFLFWVPHWFFFSLGSAIFFYRDKAPHKLLTHLLVFLSLVGLFKFQYSSNIPFLLTAIVTSVFIMISFNFQQRSSKLTEMGNLSYSVYLIHVPIGVHIFCLLKTDWMLKSSVFNFLFDITSLLLIMICAHFVYKFIEMRYIKMGKKISNKFKASRI